MKGYNLRFIVLLFAPMPNYLASLLLLLSLFIAPALRAEELPDTVLTALRDAGISREHIGVFVQAVDAPAPSLHHRADQAMNPASTMKLLTSYAALELLGPAYQWKTEALTDSAVSAEGAIHTLYLRGTGDPRFSQEEFWLLLRRLRARGIDEIRGDVVLDRESFVSVNHAPGSFDNEPLRPYNVGPNALLVNLQSLQFAVRPDATQKHVEILLETPVEEIKIANHVKLVEGACGDWREKLKIAVNAHTIEISGQYSRLCQEKPLYLSPWDKDRYTEQLFRALWKEQGGRLRGQVLEGRTAPQAKLITAIESSPLADVIRDINKFSNNVMARQVFIALDAARPASAEGAKQRIKTWLTHKKLNLAGLVMDNGSGLSRRERISAEGLGALLLAAWKSPVMPEFMSSLPIAGIDGTLRRRLGDSPLTGRAHLKTGYLDGVRAIAGYVMDSRDRRWVVVFLINSPKSGQGKPAMDALLRWVADQ